MSTEQDVPAWLRPLSLRPVPASRSETSLPSTVCARCPRSLWYVTLVIDKPKAHAFCRAMGLLVWSPGKENPLLDCDQARVEAAKAEKAQAKRAKTAAKAAEKAAAKASTEEAGP